MLALLLCGSVECSVILSDDWPVDVQTDIFNLIAIGWIVVRFCGNICGFEKIHLSDSLNFPVV